MRRVLAFAVVVVAAAALAAVMLTRGGSASAAAAVVRAAEKTSAGSSRVEIVSSFGPRNETRGAGEIDYAHRRGQLRFAGGDAGRLVSTILFDGAIVYLRAPELGRMLHTTREWIEVDLARLDRRRFDVGRSLADPSDILAFLRGTSANVRAVGSERVRGVATTRYRGTIDFARVTPQAPARDRGVLRALRAFLRFQGVDGIPYDVWVDGDGLARRVRTETRLASVRVTQTVDFYDFGIDVRVTPPPPEAVFDANAVLDLLRGSR